MATTIGSDLYFKMTLQPNTGGPEFIVDMGNLRYCTMYSSIVQYPTCEFEFQDVGGVLGGAIGAMGIVDGFTFKIEMGIDPPDISTYKESAANQRVTSTFRIFDTPSMRQDGQAQLYKVVGLVDRLKLLRQIPQKSYYGTSIEVLDQICKECNVVLKNDENIQTKDKQVWLPLNRSYINFIQHIVDHSYIPGDPPGCLGFAIVDELDPVCIISDLTTKKKKKATFELAGKSRDNIPVLDYKRITAGGLFNFTRGTANSRLSWDASGALQEYDKIKYKPINETVNQAQDLNQLSLIRAEYAPISSNTVHGHFQEAFHISKRIEAVFTLIIDIQVDRFANPADQIDIFDWVELIIYDRTDNQLDQHLSGLYMLTNRNRMVQGTKYYERLRLVSDGFGTNPGNILKNSIDGPGSSTAANPNNNPNDKANLESYQQPASQEIADIISKSLSSTA